jgi:hypothetical protein
MSEFMRILKDWIENGMMIEKVGENMVSIINEGVEWSSMICPFCERDLAVVNTNFVKLCQTSKIQEAYVCDHEDSRSGLRW